MGPESKIEKLKALYRLHDDFMAGRKLACRPGCHTCCTRDLTATTLEGLFLILHCRRTGRRDLIRRLEAELEPGFRPRLTINGLAKACLESEQVPEEVLGSGKHPCPLLEDGLCAAYPARPLGCRAMASAETCPPNGAALMDPLVLTVNTVFQQVVEQLDLPGFFGNLADVIRFLNDGRHGPAYQEGRSVIGKAFKLAPNQPAAALMVPPEHRAGIRPVLEKMGEVLALEGG